jgi:DNA processing protein
MAHQPAPPAPDDDQRLARAVLTDCTTPGDPHTHRMITDLGPVTTYLHVTATTSRHRLTETTWHDSMRAHRIRTLMHLPGVRVLIPGDPDWPTGLDRLPTGRTTADQPIPELADLPGPAATPAPGPQYAPPPALWIRGDTPLRPLLDNAVTITGARAATAYGIHITSEITGGCAERGYTVVSGAGFGIDAAAHRAALTAGHPTIAVLASGIDRPHPASNTDLCHRITHDGLLLSEFPPDADATRARHLARHRLLAALTRGTVLVEAARHSSSIRTLTTAIALDRAAMAVPGPVTSALSTGCHRLLRDRRAHLVTNAHDVITHLEQR